MDDADDDDGFVNVMYPATLAGSRGSPRYVYNRQNTLTATIMVTPSNMDCIDDIVQGLE